MVYIDSFIKAIEKRQQEEKISCDIQFINDKLISYNCRKAYSFPEPISNFYNEIESLKIVFPRKFEIISCNKMEYFEDRFLWFSTINENVKIYFDTHKLNNANEWDIINLENNFLITKSFASYVTNKVWAWIDRNRVIWKDEIHTTL